MTPQIPPSEKTADTTQKIDHRLRNLRAALTVSITAILVGLTFQESNQSNAQAISTQINNRTTPSPTLSIDDEVATIVAGTQTAEAQKPTVTPTPTLIRLPEEPPAEEQLQATATALSKEELQDSFVPEGEFTRETFEKVQQATYMIEVVSEFISGENKGMLSINFGTGWLAKNEENRVIIVTNRHVVSNPELKRLSIRMWRPGIDDPSQISATTRYRINTSEKYDVGVISYRFFEELPKQFVDAKPLPFIDKAPLQKQDQVLVVGFPADFAIYEPDHTSRTFGDVMKIEGSDFQIDQPIFFARGLSNSGASGSPVVLLKSGEPFVVGMLFAGWRDNFKIDEFHEQKQNRNVFTALDLSRLLTDLDDKATKFPSVTY